MARGLGKGINALFPNLEAGKEDTVQSIKIKDLRPNPYQPRKVFRQEAIEELKTSIVQHGILQPIIARKSIKGYEIAAGERRFRAAQAAGLKTVPVVVREMSEQQMMELSVLENLQREDLNPMEEAAAYQMLLDKLQITQEELASRLGKSRPHIANHIRLLSLPDTIREDLSEGRLSMGHGRALLSIKDQKLLIDTAAKVIKEKWNVRQLETYIQQIRRDVPRETVKTKPVKNVFLKEKEAHLRERFGTTVTIKKSKKKGRIEIEFFSEEDLDRIIEILEDRSASS